MALREETYKAYFPIETGISINNPKGFKVGLKLTDSELLIISEKGLVMGILDRKFFSIDSIPGAKPVKKGTTKKRTVKV